MTTFAITDRFTGNTVVEVEAETLRDAVIKAIRGGADLSRADLLGADLSRADLSLADLSGTNLSRADLSGTNLSRANLSRANLSLADLSRANLSLADLSGANLSRANLSRANLSLADLSLANLSLADLSLADLSRANLSRANLSLADLSGANLSRANLSGANLSGANLLGAKAPWSSHDFIADALRRAAEDDVDKLKYAGLHLMRREWCWSEFLTLNDPLKGWALDVLARYVTEGDSAPKILRDLAAPRLAAEKPEGGAA